MMHVLSRFMFGALNLAARRGFAPGSEFAANSASAGDKKLAAREKGVRGETFAYWYLRCHGYVMIARNFTVAGMKGELDLVGYDGDVLAFVEVKLRSVTPNDDIDSNRQPLPEEAVGSAKRRDLIRMARQFLAHWRKHKGPFRFDILAIEARDGKPPIVRLHKDAFATHI